MRRMSAKKTPTPGHEAASAVRAARARVKAAKAAEVVGAGLLTFRAFMSSPDYFPGGIALSPALWAIIDASDGRPDLVPADICREIFHCEPSALPTRPSRVVGVGAGRQGGKTSRLLAPKAVHLAWTVPLPDLRPGQIARVAIVAPDLDAATATLNYVKGIVGTSEVLRCAVPGDAIPEDPEDIGNTVAVVLRRPDGKLVDITVRAAARGGRSVRSRSLCGLILDEACFLHADDGHTVNDRSIFDGALPAIVDGGQVWIASTPYIEGEGLLEQLIADNWAKGTQGNTALVAARVRTKLLRPGWDPTGEQERAMRSGPDGDITTDREILAIPHAAGSRRYFAAADVDRAMGLPAPALTPEARGGGADYGHTSDRSALAIAERYPDGRFAVPLVMGIPSSPDQKPSDTYREVALVAKSRGVRAVASDVHYKESVREEYERHGVSFEPAAPTDAIFDAGRSILREQRLCLAGLPETDRAMLAKQFAAVLLIPQSGGKARLVVPRASVKDAAAGKGTTHCDELVAVLTALHEVGSGDPGLWAHAVERRVEAAAAGGQTWTPPRGSTAYLAAQRRGGQVPSGKFW